MVATSAASLRVTVGLIPSWPRRLMMVQVCILFVTTGLLKHDGAWLEGDAVYYALMYDHFVRFRLDTVLAHLGGGVLACLTWGARMVEAFFPLVLIGIVGRWSASRFDPIEGITRTVVTLSLAAALAASSLIVYTTGAPRLLPVTSPELATLSWVAIVGGTYFSWSLARRPGRIAVAGWFDAQWLGSRVFGRRLWIISTASLLLGMWVFMNIGLFHPVTMATLIVFFSGQEVAGVLQSIRSCKRIATPTASTASPALAYSRRARAIGGVLLGWHLLALAVASLPQTAVTAPLRDRVGMLAGPWMSMTRTRQSWGMWATVPVENIFMKAVVVHEGNEQRDLRTDLYAAELRPLSPFGYDRWWKIAERIIKSAAEAPYRPAYARWLCRRHAAAVAVELRSVTVSIPTPAENRRLRGTDLITRLQQAAVERVVFSMDCP